MATVAGARTLPYDWYADQAVLRVEQESIFARSWQYAARLEQVAEPGQLTTAWAGSLPVVLARARDGELPGLRQRLPPPRHHPRATVIRAARRSSAPTTRGRTASTDR